MFEKARKGTITETWWLDFVVCRLNWLRNVFLSVKHNQTEQFTHTAGTCALKFGTSAVSVTSLLESNQRATARGGETHVTWPWTEYNDVWCCVQVYRKSIAGTRFCLILTEPSRCDYPRLITNINDLCFISPFISCLLFFLFPISKDTLKYLS